MAGTGSNEPEDETQAPLSVPTLAFLKHLWSGDVLAAPVADLALAAHGEEVEAVEELRLFLSESLAKAEPERIARFVLPAATKFREVEIPLARDDLARRFRRKIPFGVPCAVIPARSGGSWVVVLPLGHTVWVAPGADLDATVRGDIERIAAARGTGSEVLRALLPARAHELRPIEPVIARERTPEGSASSQRRARVERERRREAKALLDSVGVPVHESVQLSTEPPFVGRDADLARLGTLLSAKARGAVLMVGPELVGKSTLVRGWIAAEKRAAREPLVYGLSAARLIAGMSGLGAWQERVQKLLAAAELLDAVIWIDRLGELLADRAGGLVDLPGALRPWLEQRRVRVLAELGVEEVSLHESRHASFFSNFDRLRIEPLDAETTARLLEARIAHADRHEPDRPNLRPDAVGPLLEAVERYLPYRALPGKAVRLYEEIRSAVAQSHEQSARRARLGADDVLDVFAMLTGIPSFLLREDRPLRAGDVTAALRRALVGQDEAVRGVVETVCVVKAGLQPPGKPLATFLFVGPTGVGKTELARALATYLFGSADRMIRFDMSEYADGWAAERLLRGDARGEGQLTRRIRRQPFSLLLLDEIEKAHPDVMDLLLQICGEGRLTDARGRVAWFHNAIIVLTSNLGATASASRIGIDAAERGAAEKHLDAIRRTLRPELINRIDRIVPFHALDREQIQAIAAMAIGRVASMRGLLELGAGLDVDAAVVDRLARDGFSAEYGARALRRHVDEKLVAPLGRFLCESSNRYGSRGAIVRALPSKDGAAIAFEPFGETEAATSWVGTQAVHKVSNLRREASDLFGLDRVREVREQVSTIVAQLTYGGAAAAGDPRVSAHIASLQVAHHRLSKAWSAAEGPAADLEALEDLAVGALLTGQDPTSTVEEAEERMDAIRAAMVYLLVALDPHLHEITLGIRAESQRVLRAWLLPLLRDQLRQRGWTAMIHEPPQGHAREDWPGTRRWSPPRDVPWAIGRFESASVPKELLLRVRGAWAGALLGLEAGLHRWSFGAHKSDADHLVVHRLAPRIEITDAEWMMEAIVPEPFPRRDVLERLPAHREVDPAAMQVKLLLNKRTLSAFPGEDYWPRFERIALAHLLAYEQGAEKDRDELHRYLLDLAAKAAAAGVLVANDNRDEDD